MMDVKNKIVLITGSSDGLGKAVAIEFAKAGAVVLLHGRNLAKGQAVLKELSEVSATKAHRYYQADFSSLREVHEFSDAVLSHHKRLDILINNAGIGSGTGKRELSQDGYELRLSVNYLAPFVLTMRLLPLLKQSVPSRIVNVASGAQQEIDFKDLMIENDYSGSRAYAQSKLAMIMFGFKLAEDLNNSGVTVNSLHPASMMDTKLVRESGGTPRTSVREGVDTVLFVTGSPLINQVTGAFYDHHAQVKAEQQAYDADARQRLYDISLKLTGKFL